MKRILLTLCMLMALALHAQRPHGPQRAADPATPRLPQFFDHGMVLQRQVKQPVWGWGQPGDKVEVSIAGRRATTTVAPDGTWKVYLPKLKAGGPHILQVKAQAPGQQPRTLQLSNILIGDVFLCSGQSNMELPVRRCMDCVADLVKDYANPQIRYLKLPQQYNFVRPNDDVRIRPWQDITPDNCAEVGALCYFMARQLQADRHVPIGIINSSVGGTRVEAWMPHDLLSTYPGYAAELAKPKYHQENWVDSINRIEMQAAFAWERQMSAQDTIATRWRQPGYDFSQWTPVDMFSDWSHGRNGSYWFHTSVELPADLAGQPGLLRFGAIRDADSIYINGTLAGNTTYQYPPRVYPVKAGILRAGHNDIVVHLMSQQGRPGFTPQKLYQLEVGQRTFTLSRQLHMAVGTTMPRKPSSTYFVDTPTGLYNAMIAPLGDFPFRGVVWYQGESNLSNTALYSSLLQGMIDSWRKQFSQPLPLVVVQLPGYQQHHLQPVLESGWTQIRHQQLDAVRHIPYAALVPTFDTGEANDIHPQEKHIVGARVAQSMNRLLQSKLGQPGQPYNPDKARRYPNETLAPTLQTAPPATAALPRLATATLRFPADLRTDNPQPQGIAVRTPNGWTPVAARLVDPRTLALTLPSEVTQPLTLRYGWDDYPKPTLFYTNGWPVPQFEATAE